ncbi:phage tail protein [Telmatospirillum sp. J64-1]|uniref:phage tail protein n=1 Tax=Telmatospirillum sp. J64-1 TaxID=2502183 RepID=UPI00115E4F9A|nr:phage tail protein [Telmatospirillum sp. J64-1]
MKKLTEARDYLLASALGLKAKDLLTFAEKGAVTAYRGDGPPSFKVSYTAHLVVVGFPGNPQDLLFVMLSWMDRHLPSAPPDALKFHVDIIDHKASDISMQIEMADVIKATVLPGGTMLQAQDDPDALGELIADQALGLHDE